MMKIGLTGGIGSGKTTAAKVFESLHIPVFYADDVSKSILDSDPKIIEQLSIKFGKELYADGQLNRALLAQKVFQDKEASGYLNSLDHPAVAKAFADWHAEQKAPYVLQEAAILFETGSYQKFDAMILVTAPEELRIKRVMHRNGWSREEVLGRMKNQWGDEKKIELANYLVNNDENQMLVPQILKIHENIISRANQSS
jgi:dephospho-CoA kinase